jgi:purine-nucleoside/S-methyl-5'-thioadenosine phosphorylase / adenosine deaminase
MKPQLAEDFEWMDLPGGRALVCRPLASHAPHVFTTRGWALGSPDASDQSEAWAAVASALNVPTTRLIRMRQVHGAAVVVRRPGVQSAGADRLPADIIVSDDPCIAVAIQTADCVPMLLADVQTGAVAAAHAGWRGLAVGVPRTVVRAMHENFGSDPRDLLVALGPSISAARYEVGGEVRAQFGHGFDADSMDRWFPRETRPNHWEFDGWSAAVDQTVSAGVPLERIHVARLCTSEHVNLLCSYRRDGQLAGRMAAAIRARS